MDQIVKIEDGKFKIAREDVVKKNEEIKEKRWKGVEIANKFMGNLMKTKLFLILTGPDVSFITKILIQNMILFII